MLQSETSQILSDINKRAMLLIKVGIKWGYGIKKDPTCPQFWYHYFDRLTFLRGGLELGKFLP